MNREVLYLVVVLVVGCIAITLRAILFNLAGERFVARLRKEVCKIIKGTSFWIMLYMLL